MCNSAEIVVLSKNTHYCFNDLIAFYLVRLYYNPYFPLSYIAFFQRCMYFVLHVLWYLSNILKLLHHRKRNTLEFFIKRLVALWWIHRTRKVTVLLYHEFLYIFECATSLRRIHDLSMMLLLYYIFYFHQLKNCLMQLV